LGSASDGAHSIYDFSRRAPGKRQQQDSFGCDALVKQKLHSGRERRCFARARTGHDAQGSVTKAGRFALTLV
jgi:hypothetical protein